MQNRTLALLFSAFSFFAFSTALAFDLTQNFHGFVSIKTKELYVDYTAPAKNKEIVVLLNGLTYSTTQWDQLVAELKTKGLGVLRYDMDGMGKTLLRHGVKPEPYAYTDQAEDLNSLLETLKIPSPYSLVGLSYGGGIAAAYSYRYAAKVKNAVLLAPYTEALEQQDNYIKFQVALTRLYFPFNPATNDQIYDYYLRQICYTTYPLVEPVVLENPLKLEGVFRMTQGIRKFRAIEEADRFPKNSVHLVIAEKDQYIPREVLTKFWQAVPAQARASFTILKGAEHKIPESKPAETAAIIEAIVNQTYQGNH